MLSYFLCTGISHVANHFWLLIFQHLPMIFEKNNYGLLNRQTVLLPVFFQFKENPLELSSIQLSPRHKSKFSHQTTYGLLSLAIMNENISLRKILTGKRTKELKINLTEAIPLCSNKIIYLLTYSTYLHKMI